MELFNKKDSKSIGNIPRTLQMLKSSDKQNPRELIAFINARLDYLMGSRPTAVDLSNAITLLKKTIQDTATSSVETSDLTLISSDLRMAYIKRAEKILEDDLTTNLAIGRYGAEYLRRQYVI